MRVFFTSKLSGVEERLEVDALDIIREDYILSIRESGVRITDVKTKEEILDFNFTDLKDFDFTDFLKEESSEQVKATQD